MEESTAVEVVEKLQSRSVFAHVNRRVGVYSVGVRVVIPDGREAIWDNDGAAGLEAMVLRDGVLVGFVPQIPDSDDLSADQIVAIIAGTDYDAPPPPGPPAHPTSASNHVDASGSVPAPAPATGAAAPGRRWTERLRRRG
jgi:hypothetical protein